MSCLDIILQVVRSHKGWWAGKELENCGTGGMMRVVKGACRRVIQVCSDGGWRGPTSPTGYTEVLHAG